MLLFAIAIAKKKRQFLLVYWLESEKKNLRRRPTIPVGDRLGGNVHCCVAHSMAGFFLLLLLSF